MKILILGSSGILGNYLNNYLKKEFDVFNNGLAKRKINLLNISKLRKVLLKINPDIIINCIANTSIDNCEFHKKNAYEINYLILKNLIYLIKKLDINTKIIQISTDQFYNNQNQNLNKEHINEIGNYYCKTKYLSEKLCLKNKMIILRTNFFGKSNSKNKSFSDWIFKSFKSKKKFYLLNDVYFSPLNLFTLSKMIKKVIKKSKDTKGIFNVGSKGCISKSEFAINFAKACNIYKRNYQLINSNKLFTIKRPKFMCMNVGKFEKHFKTKMPSVYNQIFYEARKYK